MFNYFTQMLYTEINTKYIIILYGVTLLGVTQISLLSCRLLVKPNKAAVSVADSQCGDQDCHECLVAMWMKPGNG